jgi:hypothetical protein
MPFSVAHMERIEVDQEEVLAHENWLKMLEVQSHAGPCVTGFRLLKPVIAFGFVPIWQGVAEAWMVGSADARKYPITMTKTGRVVMDIAKISMGLHRLQITVRNTDKRAESWAYAIGFWQESVMKKYGPDGEDYLMMTRF